MYALPNVPLASKYWPFRGGLNLVSPSITIPAGFLRSSSNVEVGVEGGYVTTQGYERYDGQAKPSDGAYYTVAATITGSYALGNTLTGASSGATGTIIAVVTGTSAYFVLTQVVGAFTSGENLQIAAVTIATASAGSVQGAAPTAALDATYKNLAADVYRALIAAVPGSGSVLGVWKYNDNVYAVRNNAGGTAAVMHKATTSGWSAVNLGREVAFTSGGTYEIAVGDVITGATSAATATITKVVLSSGSWAAGTAAGYLYFASQTGTFQAENLDVPGHANSATIAGNSSAITLSPSGRFEFINYNFGGAASSQKMYGCDGVNKAFEFNGTAFAWIRTGMATDAPDHIAAFKLQLFLGFDASLQHSAITDPFTWSAILGAGELAMGENITNIVNAPGGTDSGALVITTRNKTKVLYGNSSSDWNLIDFNPDAGALAYTAQFTAGRMVWLDDRGITDMQTSQAFGNFHGADLSQLVSPYIKALRSTAIAACVVREKNQYRLFFSGGAALYTTFVGGKVAGVMPIALTNPVACICSLEAGDGVEETFFGSTNGMVYQMEKGTSHDGEAIAWSAELAYNHFGSPRQLKTFRSAGVEVSGSGYCAFTLGYNVGYGSSELPQGATTSLSATLNTANWDTFIWDAFYWDGQTLSPSFANLDGTAENISLVFAGSSDEYQPITFNGAVVDFSPRRMLR
jgi:hypothetical protein